jgi:hypothetical protein
MKSQDLVHLAHKKGQQIAKTVHKAQEQGTSTKKTGKVLSEDQMPRWHIPIEYCLPSNPYPIQAPSPPNSLYKGPLPPVLASSDSSDSRQPSKTLLKQDPPPAVSLPSPIVQYTSTNRSKPLSYPITHPCIFVHPLFHQSGNFFPI